VRKSIQESCLGWTFSDWDQMRKHGVFAESAVYVSADIAAEEKR
jgi:hypothetical protein